MALKIISNPLMGGTSSDPVQVYAAPYYPGTKVRHWVLINLDPANSVYYDDSPSINNLSNILMPKCVAAFDGTSDVWCSTLGGPAVAVQTGIRGQTAYMFPP